VRLLPLPVNPFVAELVRPVRQLKGIWASTRLRKAT